MRLSMTLLRSQLVPAVSFNRFTRVPSPKSKSWFPMINVSQEIQIPSSSLKSTNACVVDFDVIQDWDHLLPLEDCAH